MNSRKPLVPLESIIKKYQLKLLVYFGSFATGEYQEGKSDLDLAFLSHQQLSADKKTELLQDLILYHRKAEIDLVDLYQAGSLLKYEIADKGRLIYEEQEGLFDEYRLYCFRYYYDTKHFREQARKDFQKRLEEALGNAE